jgi:hypothetical protein
LQAVAYYFGFRKFELLGMRVSQIDVKARTIQLHTGETKSGRGPHCSDDFGRAAADYSLRGRKEGNGFCVHVGERRTGSGFILPIWHGVGFDEVRGYSPTLADRIAVSTDKGLEYVVEKILDATTGPSARAFVPHPAEQREQMIFEESVCWKIRHGQKEGPYLSKLLR